MKKVAPQALLCWVWDEHCSAACEVCRPPPPCSQHHGLRAHSSRRKDPPPVLGSPVLSPTLPVTHCHHMEAAEMGRSWPLPGRQFLPARSFLLRGAVRRCRSAGQQCAVPVLARPAGISSALTLSWLQPGCLGICSVVPEKGLQRALAVPRTREMTSSKSPNGYDASVCDHTHTCAHLRLHVDILLLTP